MGNLTIQRVSLLTTGCRKLLGSALFLLMPPDGAENPKVLKKPPIKPPALAGTVGRVVPSLNMRHKQQDMRGKAVYSSNLARKLFA